VARLHGDTERLKGVDIASIFVKKQLEAGGLTEKTSSLTDEAITRL